MHFKHLSATGAVATLFLLPLASHAGFIVYGDNAANPEYASGYAGKGGDVPGFGAYSVTMNGSSSGTFVASASESEGNNGTPAPSTIDTSGVSFGMYANGGSTSSVTVKRTFNIPGESGPTAGLKINGESFSLNFVPGYNDGGSTGTAGVSLLTNSGSSLGLFRV